MGDDSQKISIKELLSYRDDLVGVLRDKRDFNIFSNCISLSKNLHSTSDTDFNASQIAISDCQKKIEDCKLKIEAAKSEEVDDEEVHCLQKEIDEEIKREQLLREEHRVIVDEINELDNRRLSLEEQRQRLKKLEEEEEKEQRKLSFYASITKLIPDLECQSKISGHVVSRDKKVVDKFEFDPVKEDAFDVCDKIWKMIDG